MIEMSSAERHIGRIGRLRCLLLLRLHYAEMQSAD